MATINLRDFYPWCKENTFVEITDEMLEAMKAADRQESAYKRRTYRYKAHYTLDMSDGIENECVVKPETPEEIYIGKETTRELFAAIGKLTKIQQRRLFAYYFEGLTSRQIAEMEGVSHRSVMAGRFSRPHGLKAYPDLERGESARETGKQHIPTRVFKQAVHLTKQAKQIEAALSGINPLNAGKKREKAFTLMDKFFPQMEDFETVLKKYRAGFSRLKQENAALTQEAKAGNENKLHEQLEHNRLEIETRELRRIVDAIPQDLKRQLRMQARYGQTKEER